MTLFFSLEREITLSVGQAREREELNHIISEKEEALRDLELETAKLVRRRLEKDCQMYFARIPLLSLSQGTIIAHHCCVCGYHSCLTEYFGNDALGTGVRPGLCSQVPCVGPECNFPTWYPHRPDGISVTGEWEGMRAEWGLFPLPLSFPRKKIRRF